VKIGARVATLGLLVASIACTSIDHRGEPSQVADSPRRGDVAFQFLQDPRRVVPHLTEDQDFMAPVPLDTPLPKYPTGDHARASGPVTLVVRIVVGEEGTVREVLESPLAGPSPRELEAFWAAAEEAVRGWSFVPAAIRTLAPGEDLDQDSKPNYTVLVDSTRVPAYWLSPSSPASASTICARPLPRKWTCSTPMCRPNDVTPDRSPAMASSQRPPTDNGRAPALSRALK